jgi:hypothetical protein
LHMNTAADHDPIENIEKEIEAARPIGPGYV